MSTKLMLEDQVLHEQGRHEPKPEGRSRLIMSRSAPIAVVLHREEEHGLTERHHSAGESKNWCGRASSKMTQIYVINADQSLDCIEEG